jgi:hypothetical protein
MKMTRFGTESIVQHIYLQKNVQTKITVQVKFQNLNFRTVNSGVGFTVLRRIGESIISTFVSIRSKFHFSTSLSATAEF